MGSNITKVAAAAILGALGAGAASHLTEIPFVDYCLGGALLLEFSALLLFQGEPLGSPSCGGQDVQHPLLTAMLQPPRLRRFIREAFKLGVFLFLGGFGLCLLSETEGTTAFEGLTRDTLLASYRNAKVTNEGFELNVPPEVGSRLAGTLAGIGGGSETVYLAPLSLAVDRAAARIRGWSRTAVGVYGIVGLLLTFHFALAGSLASAARDEVAAGHNPSPTDPSAPASPAPGSSE